MRIVTANEWQEWQEEGAVLEKDARGPKVLRLANGHILKIFRPRRRLWLARLMPQARRFAQNAIELQARRIEAPTVIECFWLDKKEAISGCLYSPLPGESLEKIFKQDRGQFDLQLSAFAKFIHELHRRGIYFRSLHLGNVLCLPEGGFGLIDFLDIHFKRGSLSASLVSRNLGHLKSYLKRSKCANFPWAELVSRYEECQGLSK